MTEPPSPYQPYGSGQPPALTADERNWGCAAHWSALVGAFLALAFLGPLLVLLVKGQESPYVRRQAVESLNFQLSILIYAIVSAVLVLVLVGFVLLIAVGLLWLILTILGTVASSRGEIYSYPLTIKLLN